LEASRYTIGSSWKIPLVLYLVSRQRICLLTNLIEKRTSNSPRA